jgi:hypothetical protein
LVIQNNIYNEHVRKAKNDREMQFKLLNRIKLNVGCLRPSWATANLRHPKKAKCKMRAQENITVIGLQTSKQQTQGRFRAAKPALHPNGQRHWW